MKCAIKTLLIALMLLSFPSSTDAQSLSLTFGVGKTYSIPMATWAESLGPGLELQLGDLVLTFQTLYIEGEKQETDLYIGYEKRLTDSISVSLNWAEYNYNDKYELETDRIWYVETKVRIFGK